MFPSLGSLKWFLTFLYIHFPFPWAFPLLMVLRWSLSCLWGSLELRELVKCRWKLLSISVPTFLYPFRNLMSGLWAEPWGKAQSGSMYLCRRKGHKLLPYSLAWATQVGLNWRSSCYHSADGENKSSGKSCTNYQWIKEEILSGYAKHP